MNLSTQALAQVHAVEQLVLEHFQTQPFHNLHLLFNDSHRRWPAMNGGTCSDKTLSFIAEAKASGFDVALHSGYIGGQEIHRLARVHIEGHVFFADVGNGWPALKLYPADHEVSYRCFGMGFRTEISNGRVRVFHERNGQESLQLDIDTCGRPEADIIADIRGRFENGIVYPFSNSLRFSMVVRDRFLFLRGDRLEVYSEVGCEVLEGIVDATVPHVLQKYFGYGLCEFDFPLTVNNKQT